MTAARLPYWKRMFEEAYRAGDKAGMVRAEENIERWRWWDERTPEEQEALLHHNYKREA